MTLLNKNLSGTPEEIKEALRLQEQAWNNIVSLGRSKLSWIKQPEVRRCFLDFYGRYENVIDRALEDDEESLFRLVHVLYSSSDAEGKVNLMMFNMLGAFVNKENGEARAIDVIHGAKKCIEFVESAKKYDERKKV